MNDRINALLAETHNELREQLSAAQRHFTRLEGLLGARESKDIAALNHAARRLRSAGAGGWVQALVEVAAPFSARVALFTLDSGSLHLEATRLLYASEDVPLDAAPAFRSAVETKDTVVAARTRGEMSAPIAALFGEAADGRFHLFPVSTGERVVALLYADGPPASMQPDALELLATLAGAVVESRTAAPSNGLVHIGEPIDQAGLCEPDLHLKGRRFARVLVAEMLLYQAEQVKRGRAERDLYAALQTQVDEAREAYRGAFLADSQNMPDYLHQELVHTLAHDDVELLGKDYPGPLA
jgi:hypothetical protein